MPYKKFHGKHFLTLRDWDAEELRIIFDTAVDLKHKLSRGEPHELLSGKTLGMIFSRQSTRTRVSCEAAMTQLGGHAQFLWWGHLQMREGMGESFMDTALVMSRYCDGLFTRLIYPQTQKMAKYSKVPVINAADKYCHPLQTLADFLTIREKKKRFENVKYVVSWGFSGDRLIPLPKGKKSWLDVPSVNWPIGGTLNYDTIFVGPRMGVDITIVCPEDMEPYDKEIMDAAKKEAETNGTEFEISHDLYEAADGADAIMIKPYYPWRDGHPIDKLPKIASETEKLKKFIINSDVVDLAKKDVIVMAPGPLMPQSPCMTDEVKYGSNSAYFDEAENRLHTVKAVLLLLMS